MDIFDQWLAESGENQRIYSQEELIVDLSDSLHEIMSQKGVTQKEIAKKLGLSKARISKLFSGKSNMTLRTLSDICFALDVKPKWHFCHNNPSELMHVVLNDTYSPNAEAENRDHVKSFTARVPNAA